MLGTLNSEAGFNNPIANQRGININIYMSTRLIIYSTKRPKTYENTKIPTWYE